VGGAGGQVADGQGSTSGEMTGGGEERTWRSQKAGGVTEDLATECPKQIVGIAASQP